MNKHILAAQLRTTATHIDRLAWRLEAYQTRLAPSDLGLLDQVNRQRKAAGKLRRMADKLAPKKVKA